MMEQTGGTPIHKLPPTTKKKNEVNPRMIILKKWQQYNRYRGQPVQNESSQKAPEEMSSER